MIEKNDSHATIIVRRRAKGCHCPYCDTYEAAADHPSTEGFALPGNYIFDCEGCGDSYIVHIPEKYVEKKGGRAFPRRTGAGRN